MSNKTNGFSTEKKTSGFSTEKKTSGFSTEKKTSGFSTEKQGNLTDHKILDVSSLKKTNKITSKSKEEKLHILHKRLLEISNKQAQEKNDKKNLEVQIEDFSNATPPFNKKNNKLKTYLIRVFIIVGVFLIFKNLNLSKLSFENIFSEKEKNSISNTDFNKEVKTIISYNLKPENARYILLGEYNSEEKAIQETDKLKSILGEIDFEVSYKYLPNFSNSELQIYKTLIGPFNLASEAKQWSKIIDKNSEIINL